ncbi:hypothetical protein [Streptomyces sp. NBC_01207]|uniref:hypothetical protein n=1 Tax=Streptomyces sp. NBC_01207 TaxID=2903772 RepID=UPI002E152B9F|nr:hypothetical protein OG457_27255 [Streptomyces sp. NBC_01207]
MIYTRTKSVIFAVQPGAPVSARTAAHLAAVATHLNTHNPTGPYTERGRMTAVLLAARTAEAAAPVLRLVQFPADHITRGEAAQRIGATARQHGAAWTGDDGEDMNAPAIPKIPGARPASDPYPAGPAPVPGPRPEQHVLAPRPLPCPTCFGEGGTTTITGATTGIGIEEHTVTCSPCQGTGLR